MRLIILMVSVSCMIGCKRHTAPDAPKAATQPQFSASIPQNVLRHEFTNSIGMKFVHISAGEFGMGSRPDEAGANATEVQHQVRLTKNFAMGQTEVTQSQWKLMMGDNPSTCIGDQLPVNDVTWDQAIDFCNRLSEKEGRTYRLPTEAEWEYACRAGTTTAFSFGDDSALLDQFGWYNANAHGKPQPVAQKRPNAWGLYDMHGNVREWCADWWAWRYPISDQTDSIGPATGTERVRRGGHCGFYAEAARSGARDSGPPETHYVDLGFRVVLEDNE